MPTTEQLLATARQCVVDCEERHDYLPATPLLAETWQPHLWVLDAMETAANVAEKECDRYRAGNTHLLEALMDMVWQFVGIDARDGIFSHTHMAAEEGAIAALIQAGMAEEVEPGRYRLLWAALETRKPKQITWEQAVRECITDPATVERLLSLNEDATSGCADGGVLDGTNRTTSGAIGQP